MKRIYIFLAMIFVLSMTTHALNDTLPVHSDIKFANEMYKQGQYSDAAKLYEEILRKGVSAELYYNLGNSYYKANEIGLAILNYERALRINPRFNDAAYNLQIAESKIVDNINSTYTFFVKRWINRLTNSATSNQWATISFALFVLMLGSFIYFMFSSVRIRRKFTFYTIIIAGTLFILTFSFAGIRKDQFVKHNLAIILSGAVTAKSAPDASGTALFQLHEGTRVYIKSTLGNWTEISLENGAVGWIEENNLGRI